MRRRLKLRKLRGIIYRNKRSPQGKPVWAFRLEKLDPYNGTQDEYKICIIEVYLSK